MLKITKEITLGEFKAWEGGKDRLETIKELDILDEAQQEIELMIEGAEEVTELTINDILWFEMDEFIAQFEEEEEEEEE